MSDIKKYVGDLVGNYIENKSWRVKENSNARYAFSGLQAHLAGAMISDYLVNYIYGEEIAKTHMDGEIHIHDMSHGLVGYCSGWSLKQLLMKGFSGVQGKISASAAKHLNALLGQLVNFFGTLQNEWAGAQAVSSFDTYLAPFVRYDKLDYKQVEQCLQEFIFSINQTSRWGNQVPFTNVTFDLKCPEDLKDQQVIIGGKLQKEKYSEFQKEMDMINLAFINLMIKGDADGRIFTFPIPTYNITKDFDWDSEVSQKLFFMTGKYGIPYFQNFINSSLKPEDVRSMCCRLQLDLKELRNKTGGLFGAGESTGSVGVATINLPRIAYNSKGNLTKFFIELERLMILAKDSLEIKRKLVTKNMEIGLMPYTKEYLGTFNNHFSTIGLIGMNEACMNFFKDKKKNIMSKDGKDFSLGVLDFMRDKLKEFQEETKHIYNLEATPAEGTSYRLAKHDKEKYKDIITAGTDTEMYYTNSSHNPVDVDGDLIEALTWQDDLQCKYTGGTVFHAFLGERIHDWRATRNLIKKIAYNCKMPYFSLTPTFSICPEHGYISGENFRCPLDSCSKHCEVYSRIVGYFRPVTDWNKGKRREFHERKTFKID